MSPRMVAPAFLDPSNTASSLAASPSRVINEYLEGIAPGHGKSPLWNVRRPGLHPFATLPAGPVRGVFMIRGDTNQDRCLAVGGAIFCEILSDGSVTHVHSVNNATTPISWATNGTAGNQVMFCSDGLGYIFDLLANTLTQITDVNFPAFARACEFMDGYFLVLKGPSTRRVQWSALEDGTSWAALDFLDVSEAPDPIEAIIRVHREIWCLGQQTTEVLYDVGDGNTVFAPLQGVFIEQGARGSVIVNRLDNTILWVTLNEDGHGMVMRADGYTPKRISTHAVEQYLQSSTTPTDVLSCAFQLTGHLFYCLTLIHAQTSWVYDVTTDRWVEWAHWDPTAVQWVPFLANQHTFCFDKHLVASRVDATVYEMDPAFVDDQLTALAP